MDLWHTQRQRVIGDMGIVHVVISESLSQRLCRVRLSQEIPGWTCVARTFVWSMEVVPEEMQYRLFGRFGVTADIDHIKLAFRKSTEITFLPTVHMCLRN